MKTNSSLDAKSIVAAAILLILTVSALRPVFLRIYTVDRDLLHQVYSIDADKGTPEYPEFLKEVAQRTPPGASIAVLVPMRSWSRGYAYAYYRASFFLAGRRVLPLVWRDESILREHFHDAEYVAVWQMPDEAVALHPIWTGRGGTLYRGAGR